MPNCWALAGIIRAATYPARLAIDLLLRFPVRAYQDGQMKQQAAPFRQLMSGLANSGRQVNRAQAHSLSERLGRSSSELVDMHATRGGGQDKLAEGKRSVSSTRKSRT